MVEISIKNLETSVIVLKYVDGSFERVYDLLKECTKQYEYDGLKFDNFDVRIRPVVMYNTVDNDDLKYFHIKDHLHDYMHIEKNFYEMIAYECAYDAGYYDYFCSTIDEYKEDIYLHKFMYDNVFKLTSDHLKSMIERLSKFNGKIEQFWSDLKLRHNLHFDSIEAKMEDFIENSFILSSDDKKSIFVDLYKDIFNEKYGEQLSINFQDIFTEIICNKYGDQIKVTKEYCNGDKTPVMTCIHGIKYAPDYKSNKNDTQE